MSKSDTSNLIKIAELKKPYGIKGWLWVFSYTDDKEDIFAMSPWWMKTAKGLQEITVSKWRKQGNGLVAQFEQVPDRNVAETMQGVTIWASKDDLVEPNEDEYYWTDLLGLPVYNQDGVCFGEIKQLFATGANDVMVVTPTTNSTDDEERLIPWHKHTVLTVELAGSDKDHANKDNAGKVVVDWEVDY